VSTPAAPLDAAGVAQLVSQLVQLMRAALAPVRGCKQQRPACEGF
jgi:hypothetical protein